MNMKCKEEYKDLLNFIQCNDYVEISWYQKKGIIRHVGFAFRGKDGQGYTLDFAPSLAYTKPKDFVELCEKNSQILKACMCIPVESKVSVNQFDGKKSEVKGVLEKVSISDTTEKKRIKELIIDLLNFNTDEYSLTRNNCRRYGKEGLKVISDSKISGIETAFDEVQTRRYDRSYNGISQIQSDDIQLISTITTLFIIISILLLILQLSHSKKNGSSVCINTVFPTAVF